MGRKPSLTKQISNELGTENKSEQLKKIQELKRLAYTLPLAVTVLNTPTGPEFAVAAPINVDSSNIRSFLSEAVTQLTRLEERERIRNEAASAINPDVPDAVLPADKTGSASDTPVVELDEDEKGMPT